MTENGPVSFEEVVMINTGEKLCQRNWSYRKKSHLRTLYAIEGSQMDVWCRWTSGKIQSKAHGQRVCTKAWNWLH